MSASTDSTGATHEQAASVYDSIVADTTMIAESIDDGSKWTRYRDAVNIWADEHGLYGDIQLCSAILTHSRVGPDKHYQKFDLDYNDPLDAFAAIAKSAIVNDIDDRN
jgi:hypothetical protein